MKKLILGFGIFFSTTVWASSLPQANFQVTPKSGEVGNDFVIDLRDSRNSRGIFSNLQFRCQTDVSAPWSSFTSSAQIRFRPMSEGSYTARCQVKDMETGLTQMTFRPYRVVLPYERNARIEVDRITVPVGEPVTFSLDFTGLKTEDARDVEVRWDFDSDGKWDTAFSRQKLVSHAYDLAGKVIPSAEVRFPSTVNGTKTFTSQLLRGIKPKQSAFDRDTIPSNEWDKITVVPAVVSAPILVVSPATTGYSESTQFHFDISRSLVPRDGWVDWVIDGQAVPELRGKTAIARSFSSPGNHEVRAQACVKRSDPICAESLVTISVVADTSDFRPEISIQNQTRTTSGFGWWQQGGIFPVTTGDKIRFTAQIQSQSWFKNPTYTYRWDFNSDGKWDTGFSSQNFAEATFSTPGTYQVIVQVQNDLSVISSTSRQVEVSAPKKLSADFSVSPSEIFVGDRVQFMPQILGDGGAISDYQVRFDADGNGVWDSEFRAGGSSTWVFTRAGTFQARMQIRDKNLSVSEVVKSITVISPDSQKPEARVTVIKQAITASGTQFLFDASESQGKSLQYFWSFGPDATGSSKLAQLGSKVTRTFAVDQNPVVTLRIVDMFGQKNEISFPVVQ